MWNRIAWICSDQRQSVSLAAQLVLADFTPQQDFRVGQEADCNCFNPVRAQRDNVATTMPTDLPPLAGVAFHNPDAWRVCVGAGVVWQ